MILVQIYGAPALNLFYSNGKIKVASHLPSLHSCWLKLYKLSQCLSSLSFPFILCLFSLCFSSFLCVHRACSLCLSRFEFFFFFSKTLGCKHADFYRSVNKLISSLSLLFISISLSPFSSLFSISPSYHGVFFFFETTNLFCRSFAKFSNHIDLTLRQ